MWKYNILRTLYSIKRFYYKIKSYLLITCKTTKTRMKSTMTARHDITAIAVIGTKGEYSPCLADCTPSTSTSTSDVIRLFPAGEAL